MPRGDGTGPLGAGPRTGRGAGYCAGFAVPGFANPVGYWGLGCGWGRGHRHMYYRTGLPGWVRGGLPYYPYYGGPGADEKAVLKNEEAWLEDQLRRVKERRQQLEKEE